MPMNYKPGPMPSQRPGFGQQMPRPPMPKPMPPQQQPPMYGQPMPFQGNALMPGMNYQPGPMQPRFPNALAMWGRR
jgi:hypothetical protein